MAKTGIISLLAVTTVMCTPVTQAFASTAVHTGTNTIQAKIHRTSAVLTQKPKSLQISLNGKKYTTANYIVVGGVSYVSVSSLNQLFKDEGFTSNTITNSTWTLNSNNSAVTNGPIDAGSGNTTVYIDGFLFEKTNQINNKTPGSKSIVKYVPVSVVMRVLQTVKAQSTLNGATWNIVDDKITSLAYSSDGTLYATTDAGVFTWNGSSWNLVPGSDSLTPIIASFSSTGVLAVGTEKGVWEYQNNKWSEVAGNGAWDSNVSGNYVDNLAWDPNGNLTLVYHATGGNKLLQFKNGAWTDVTSQFSDTNSTLANEDVLSIAYTQGGNLAMSTTNGAFVYQNNQWVPFGGPVSPVSSVPVINMSCSSSGVATFASRYGEFIYQNNQWYIAGYPQALAYQKGQWSPASKTSSSPLDNYWGFADAVSPSGTITVNSEAGLWQLSNGTWTEINSLPIG